MIDDTIEKDNIAILKKVPVLYADRPGRNLNVYPEEEIINAVNYFNQVSELDKTYRYIYIRHTNDEIGEKETLQLVAGWIVNFYYDKNTKTLYADVKLLPTTWGKLIKWLVKHNYPVGTSIRGSGIPNETYMDWNGENVRAIIRKNFKLKGFDFVVEPSFITTQIAGEEYITEQTIKEKIFNQFIVDECLTDKEICELNDFCSKCNTKIQEATINDNNLSLSNIGGLTMENIEKEKLDIEKEKLSIEKERLTIEIDKLQIQKTTLEKAISELQEKVNLLEKEKAEVNEQVEKIKAESNEQVEKIKAEIKSLIYLKEDIEKELETLRKKIEDTRQELEIISKEKETLENTVKVLEQSAKDEKVIVRKFGKVFDEENLPKVRLVDPEERILSTDWGNVNKDELRKIAYLAWKGGNKDIVKAFGLLDENWENDWKQWLYPVCQFVKSEESDYDFDCVLNLNGLKTAYVFMVGKPGMSLTSDQKKILAKNLLYWYKKVYELGKVEDIPEALTRLTEATLVQVGDEIVDLILETLQMNGYLNIEIPEDLKEQNDKEFRLVEAEDLYINLAKATADAILGKVYTINNEFEKVVEQVIYDIESIDVEEEITKFFDIMVSITSFESIEEAQEYIEEVFDQESISDIFLSLKPIISSVVSYLTQEGIEPDKAVNYVMNILSLLATQYEENEDENDEGKEECKNEGNDECTDEIKTDKQEIQTDENIPVDTQTKTKKKDTLYEQANNENLNIVNKEDLEMETIKSIIALVKDKYDLDVEVSADNITDILAQIFESHAQLAEKVSDLEAKVEELMKAKTQKEISIQPKTEEEVQEQTFERKGTVKVKKDSKDEEDLFVKLMKNV